MFLFFLFEKVSAFHGIFVPVILRNKFYESIFSSLKAVQNNHPKAVKALIVGRDNIEVNVNIKDYNGDYPIHIAVKLASKEVLCYLLKSQRIVKDAVDKVGVHINFNCCIVRFIGGIEGGGVSLVS